MYTKKVMLSLIKGINENSWIILKANIDSFYHWKVIKAGFSAIGSNMWLAATVAMGKIATKSLISHVRGMKEPVARIIIPAIANVEKAKENLNFFRTLGTSMKKFENSASLDVAPHVWLLN